MDLLLYILLLAVTGLFVGALGRLALPGRDPMSLGQTILVGVAATLIAGLLAMALFGAESGGILLSVLVAMGIVFIVRKMRERGTRAAAPAGTSRRF
jgi:uncharacterized membrane protein YeaQ/YmgE (transglycosylase-associated protein family)